MKRLILVLISLCVCGIMSSYAENVPVNKPTDALETMASESNASTSWYIKNDTFACTTEQAFDEMTRACNRKDQKTLERMASRGTLAVLKKGIQVDMVKYGMAKCRIQVLSGTYKDIYFYVATEFVDKK